MKLWKEYAIEPSLFANYHLGDATLAGIGIRARQDCRCYPASLGAGGSSRDCRATRHPTSPHRAASRRAPRRDQPPTETVERRAHLEGASLRGPRDGAFRLYIARWCRWSPGDSRCVIRARRGRVLGHVEELKCTHAQPRIWQQRSSQCSAKPARSSLSMRISIPLDKVQQSKWLRPLRALAATLATDGRLARFEIHALNHREVRRRWDPGLFAANCRTDLCAALPRGVTINALLWSERNGGEQFHERLIVTDIGGVVIDPGIDDGPDGEIYKLRLISKLDVPGYLSELSWHRPLRSRRTRKSDRRLAKNSDWTSSAQQALLWS